jgi:hypothetical protein
MVRRPVPRRSRRASASSPWLATSSGPPTEDIVVMLEGELIRHAYRHPEKAETDA